MSKCPACNDEFSEEFKLPKVLPCGHTYCLICIFAIFQNQNAFVCRDCREVVRDPNVIKKLPNNYAIIKLLQQIKAQKGRDFSPPTFFSQSTSNPFHDFPDNTISFSSPSFENFRRSYSPSRVGPSPDSFNFTGFKNFLDDMASVRDKALFRSFTEPRKSRSKTPPHRINDIEFTEKGVFREKKPPLRDNNNFNPILQQQQQQFVEMQDICSIRSCNNPKMYFKGGMQPFCTFHFNQFSQQAQFIEEHNQNKHVFPPNAFPHSGMAGHFANMQFAPSTTGSTGSHVSNSQQFHSSSHEIPSPQNSNKSFHKFGKPSALELMRFYDKTPTPSKANSVNTSMHNRSNSSSVFASFGPKDSQSFDFGKTSMKNSGPQVPFPEMKELFTPAQKEETKNRCIIPGCTNQQLVYKGMTYPVCGRKCWAKWQSLPRETPFWS